MVAVVIVARVSTKESLLNGALAGRRFAWTVPVRKDGYVQSNPQRPPRHRPEGNFYRSRDSLYHRYSATPFSLFSSVVFRASNFLSRIPVSSVSSTEEEEEENKEILFFFFISFFLFLFLCFFFFVV